MVSPITLPPSSCAPRLTAAIRPPYPPVTTTKPFPASNEPSWCARPHHSSLSVRRADPITPISIQFRTLFNPSLSKVSLMLALLPSLDGLFRNVPLPPPDWQTRNVHGR